MKKYRVGILIILDALLVNFSIIVSLFLRFSLDETYLKIPAADVKKFTSTAVGITLIFILVFYLFKLYSSLWRYASVSELLSIVSAASIATISSYFYGILFSIQMPRSIYVISWMLIMFFVGGVRFSYRIFWRACSRRSKEKSVIKNVLVVGAGSAGARVIKEMQKDKGLGYYPVGIIDDNKYKQGKFINGVRVIGIREDIVRRVKQKKVDEIIIAMPSATRAQKKEIIDICKNLRCKVSILPSVTDMLGDVGSISRLRDVDIEDLLGRDSIKLDNENIAGYISNKVVLVTGGGGSIGSELCRQIAKFNPKELIIFDIYENNAYDLQNELKKLSLNLNLSVLIGSIRDRGRVESIFKEYCPDVVFHAAAHKHVPLMEGNPGEAIKNNVFGTLNVAQSANKYGTKRFVLVSTDKAVNPTNVMGATKRICEMMIQSIDKRSKTEFAAVRFGNVLGSNGSVIPLFKKQIASGGPVTVTHPEINRFFMTIPEAAQLVIQAGAMAQGGEIFILNMGHPVKIVDLARDLIRLSGLEPDIDIKIVFTGLRPGEKLYEEVLMEEEGLKKTAHEKICIGKLSDMEYQSLLQELSSLEEVVNKNNAEAVISALKNIVPTYKPAVQVSRGIINEVATAGSKYRI